VIFGSGRPTIIIPHESKRARGFSLGTVIVAWDFSRQAARAVADALPLLEEAKRVFVVTVANEKHINTQRSGVELTKHLAHHAIEASFESIDADGRGIAETLEWYANKQDADMLVMGAYGHPRIREFVLGGATRSMLLRPPLPILLSH
jgi:nucleotide-binding universal stress UspA family protein